MDITQQILTSTKVISAAKSPRTSALHRGLNHLKKTTKVQGESFFFLDTSTVVWGEPSHVQKDT